MLMPGTKCLRSKSNPLTNMITQESHKVENHIQLLLTKMIIIFVVLLSRSLLYSLEMNFIGKEPTDL